VGNRHFPVLHKPIRSILPLLGSYASAVGYQPSHWPQEMGANARAYYIKQKEGQYISTGGLTFLADVLTDPAPSKQHLRI